MFAAKLAVGGITVDVERKNIKHLHLAVYPPDGRVHLSAPKNASAESVNLFLLSKLPWLMEKREVFKNYVVQPPREFVSGEAHYFEGRLYRLRVVCDKLANESVRIDGDYLAVSCHVPKRAAEVLFKWYQARLLARTHDAATKWCAYLAIPAVNEIRVKRMKSRWGSCNPRKRILTFNLELAKKPLHCLEYVVVHEVMHLLEANHSARFHALLDKYLPNWEAIKKQLNEFPL